jgi:hypothetical protein
MDERKRKPFCSLQRLILHAVAGGAGQTTQGRVGKRSEHELIRLGDEGIDEASVSIYDAAPGKAKENLSEGFDAAARHKGER